MTLFPYFPRKRDSKSVNCTIKFVSVEDGRRSVIYVHCVTLHRIFRKIAQHAHTGDRTLFGTIVAKSRIRTRRVDKGKSGQAQKTAVSGGFGGGILSRNKKQTFDSFGGTEWRLLRS